MYKNIWRKITNHNGAELSDFCTFNKLKITHQFHRHKDIHKFTWEARENKSVTVYIIINVRLNSNIAVQEFLWESKFIVTTS